MAFASKIPLPFLGFDMTCSTHSFFPPREPEKKGVYSQWYLVSTHPKLTTSLTSADFSLSVVLESV